MTEKSVIWWERWHRRGWLRWMLWSMTRTLIVLALVLAIYLIFFADIEILRDEIWYWIGIWFVWSVLQSQFDWWRNDGDYAYFHVRQRSGPPSESEKVLHI